MASTPPESIAPLWRRACEAAIAFRHDVPHRAATPQDDYAASLAGFEADLPEAGTDPSDVLGDLVRLADPGLMTPTGPRFFGWVIGGSHPAGVAADWLTSAWGQNAGNHQASPSASAAETVASRWLLELLDLPRESSLGFVTVPTETLRAGMSQAGLPEVVVNAVVGIQEDFEQGAFDIVTGDVEKLAGRPPKDLREALRAALQ